MVSRPYKDEKQYWRDINESILPFCFDSCSQDDVCKNCGFSFCKFHPSNDKLIDDITYGKRKSLRDR